jgi:hypothetical protein
MARQIRVRKEHVKLSAKEIDLLHKTFFEQLQRSERDRLNSSKDQITITADGTGYRLWYRGETELQQDFVGSNITTPTRKDEPLLLDWMKQVFLKVEQPSATARR